MSKQYEVYNADQINEFQLLQVMDDLERKHISYARIRPGNDCIWVTHTHILDCYYIFRDGRIVDIQYD